MKTSNYKRNLAAAIVAASLGFSMAAEAAVSADQAARLGAELTPFGAERNGNDSGTIPAWSPEPMAIDEVLQDEPQFTITAANYQQYTDQLIPGLEAMFEKYPDSFKMNVYPTRRTHRMPQWVYDNIRENATEATLVAGGNGVEGAYGGTAFPLPQSGEELIWNHISRWRGEGQSSDVAAYGVYSDGNITYTRNQVEQKYTYYQQGGEEQWDGLNGFYFQETVEPSRRSGELLLLHEPMNPGLEPRKAWQYIPGQRRVRRAPTVAYDTPTPTSNGMAVFDETFHFNGALDRYDWTLVGKQEMFVPYNDNRFVNAVNEGVKVEDLFPAGHPNPDFRRWELHRVWVAEATLKEGKRHVYAKRRFYIDEDTWTVVMSEAYDGRGDLWKVNYGSPYYAEELPGVVVSGNIYQDLLSGHYYVHPYTRETFHKGGEDDFYSTQSLRRQARR